LGEGVRPGRGAGAWPRVQTVRPGEADGELGRRSSSDGERRRGLSLWQARAGRAREREGKLGEREKELGPVLFIETGEEGEREGGSNDADVLQTPLMAASIGERTWVSGGEERASFSGLGEADGRGPGHERPGRGHGRGRGVGDRAHGTQHAARAARARAERRRGEGEEGGRRERGRGGAHLAVREGGIGGAAGWALVGWFRPAARLRFFSFLFFSI
jgi:hypothetical protein